MIAGRTNPSPSRSAATFASLFALAALQAPATAQLTTPEHQFGSRLGTDYPLVNYVGLTEYWHLLAEQSNRMTVESIGRSEERREQWMATITSPANRPNLERYKEISRRLARAEGVSEEAAWGQQHLEGGTSMIEADIGAGKLFLFGPKITFRSQPHGTFPLLFNGIHYGAAKRRGPVS